MKFAKELEEDLVPEWRAKYFDYKQGKKKVKAVSRAVREAQRSPTSGRIRGTPKRPNTGDSSNTPFLGASNGYGSFWQSKWSHSQRPGSSDEDEEESDGNSDIQEYGSNGAPNLHLPQPAQTRSQPVPGSRQNGNTHDADSGRRYGSIVGTPPSPLRSGGASLRLPGPAMDPDAQGSGTIRKNEDGEVSTSMPRLRPSRRSAPAVAPADGSAFEAGKTIRPFRHVAFSGHTPKRSKSAINAGTHGERSLLRRIFSPKPGSQTAAQSEDDMPLEALKAIDIKQAEFFEFLDRELNKIETFYDSKEEEASKRLETLRAQLHIMRDHRLEEIVQAQRRKEAHQSKGNDALEGVDEFNNSRGHLLGNPEHLRDLPNAMDMIYHPIQTAKQIQFRPHPQHQNNLATPPSSAIDHHADYTRRPEKPEVPYLTAKRKLKAALQEYYRGLELLKAYALLNRTAFRKINKKYDKAVHARPTMRYMYERVNNAQFVKSSVLDGHITAVEDLYSRYFEKGNHKVAVNKLRKKNSRIGHYTGSVFRSGVFAAAGLVFAIEGLVYGAELLFDPDPVIASETSFLFQLYGGYFLCVYLVMFFIFDCAIFEHARVNFRFVFEYDPRTTLSWQQLAELPCLLFFLLGVSLWLNFSRIGGETMYIYWPVILMGLTTIIVFAPVPILYHNTRKWFAYTLWRLFFAGLYPVEFRDFFSGDILCSLTYATGNIEVFFCLYAHHWVNPSQCGSSKSRLQGFFHALPGVLRLLQCLRRYYDTRNVFPHLVNGGKYTAMILQAASLSVYRIDENQGTRAFFIAVSTIYSVYASTWDLLMDWSLLDPNAPHPYLRANLAYKNPYAYYAAIMLDPILRCTWIFYAIFYNELQHSAVLAFMLALGECTRRGIWVIFRVENEHNTNVGRFRASRDVPLPYKTPVRESEEGGAEFTAEDEEEQRRQQAEDDAIAAAGGVVPRTPALSSRHADRGAAQPPGSAGASTGADVEAGMSPAVASLRRRPATSSSPSSMSIRERFGRIIRGAHAQDFERRRKSEDDEDGTQHGDDDDDEDADDAAEHAQDLETGGHGMDREDTIEVGRRLRTPVAGAQSDGDRGDAVRSRWQDIAHGVLDYRRSRQGVEAMHAGDATRRGSDTVIVEEGDDDAEDGSPHNEEDSLEEDYDNIDDRRDIVSAKILTEHGTGNKRRSSDEDNE